MYVSIHVGVNTALNFIVVNATLARTTERVLDCTLKLEAGDHIERKLAAILKFRERERENKLCSINSVTAHTSANMKNIIQKA